MILDQSSIDLSDLRHKVENGIIDVQPSFQRGEVWSEAKKKRLIDTILRQWYVPAIHLVVNDDLDREEVLDGQQRVRTILAFLRNEIAVDGSIEPFDGEIASYDSLYFSDLPSRTQSRIKRYTLTTVRLRNYEPDEPGELFFRLNQLTALTAAEQRNALVGEPRNQIRLLSERLENEFTTKSFGFKNSRLNYDDVLSRLVVSIESRSLSSKISAKYLESRYREQIPFSDESIELAQYSISIISHFYEQGAEWRLNKASLFSWLYFISDHRRLYGLNSENTLSLTFHSFEMARASKSVHLENELFSKPRYFIFDGMQRDRIFSRCIEIFNDRSSSRVNNTSSVLLRDFVLHFAYSLALEQKGEPTTNLARYVNQLANQFIDEFDSPSMQTQSEFRLSEEWEIVRANSLT